MTTFTALSLTDAEATTLGQAAITLLKRRLVDGKVNTHRGGKTPAGLARCLTDVLQLDSERNMTIPDEAAGNAIVELLALRRKAPNGWYTTSVGDKSAKGLALTVLRLFREPDFVQSLR